MDEKKISLKIFFVHRLSFRPKPVVVEILVFGYRDYSKNNCLTPNVRTVEILMMDQNHWFSVKHSSTVVFFAIQTFLIEIEHVVDAKYRLDYSDKENQLHSSHFSDRQHPAERSQCIFFETNPFLQRFNFQLGTR